MKALLRRQRDDPPQIPGSGALVDFGLSTMPQSWNRSTVSPQGQLMASCAAMIVHHGQALRAHAEAHTHAQVRRLAWRIAWIAVAFVLGAVSSRWLR